MSVTTERMSCGEAGAEGKKKAIIIMQVRNDSGSGDWLIKRMRLMCDLNESQWICWVS